MKKWSVSILAVITSVASFLLPSITAYVSHHPQVAAQIAAAAVVVAHLMKSPTAAQ